MYKIVIQIVKIITNYKKKLKLNVHTFVSYIPSINYSLSGIFISSVTCIYKMIIIAPANVINNKTVGLTPLNYLWT